MFVKPALPVLGSNEDCVVLLMRECMSICSSNAFDVFELTWPAAFAPVLKPVEAADCVFDFALAAAEALVFSAAPAVALAVAFAVRAALFTGFVEADACAEVSLPTPTEFRPTFADPDAPLDAEADAPLRPLCEFN